MIDSFSSVSIILLCFNRAKQLGPTLRSIHEQNYPGLEIVVAEDDDDGLTEEIAREYGAKYVRHVRAEYYPAFQSIAVVRNLGVKASTGDILVMHDGETYHEGSVIAPLAETVRSQDCLAVAQAKMPEGHYVTGIVGARPQALRRGTFEAMGGFEEQFFGYGCEDSFFVWLLNRRGIPVVQIDAKAVHQAHEATGGAFEEYTGFSNVALAWALTYEIEMGERPSVANYGPLKLDGTQPIYGLDDMFPLFDRRNAASSANNEQERLALEIEWARGWAGKCEEKSKTEDNPQWVARLLKCRDKHIALAGAAGRMLARRTIKG
jgi:glycosyltransferase involved in cell wall biosynthesis